MVPMEQIQTLMVWVAEAMVPEGAEGAGVKTAHAEVIATLWEEKVQTDSYTLNGSESFQILLVITRVSYNCHALPVN